VVEQTAKGWVAVPQHYSSNGMCKQGLFQAFKFGDQLHVHPRACGWRYPCVIPVTLQSL
jgi:hypothetical protein